jgi:hypothetical protein
MILRNVGIHQTDYMVSEFKRLNFTAVKTQNDTFVNIVYVINAVEYMVVRYKG